MDVYTFTGFLELNFYLYETRQKVTMEKNKVPCSIPSLKVVTTIQDTFPPGMTGDKTLQTVNLNPCTV